MRSRGRGGIGQRKTSGVALLLVGLAALAACTGQGTATTTTTLPSSSVAQDLVPVEEILAHLQAFERIADQNGGNRAAGLSGHDASADHVAQVLEAAGYHVQLQEFTFPAFEQTGPSTVQLIPPGTTTFQDGPDFKAMLYSASGDVTAPIVPVGFDPAAQGRTGKGCDAADFQELPEGAVALVQAGPCYRRDQVVNAQTAGAVAVIVSYPEWSAGSVRRPTLLTPELIHVPALTASHEMGVALAERAEEPDAMIHVVTDAVVQDRTTVNVIAETADGDPGNVVMAGGHLDSAIDGPGINDNGSGTATILEVAVRLAEADVRVENRVRFAFWSGEELGLLGSTFYVDGLAAGQREAIAAYLNFDMVASPNFARLVYGDPEAPPGSEVIAGLFEAWFADHGLKSERFDLGGASDHGPFERAGIPIGGLFSGATELKTHEQLQLYGGREGEPMDECYHLSCDRLDHLSEESLDQLSEAAAQVMVMLAQDTSLLGR